MQSILTYGSYFGVNMYQINFIYDSKEYDIDRENTYRVFKNYIIPKYGMNSQRQELHKEVIQPYLVDKKGNIINTQNYYNSGIIGGCNIPEDILYKFIKELIDDYNIPITIVGTRYYIYDNKAIDKSVSYLRIKANLYEEEELYKLEFIYSTIRQQDYINKRIKEIKYNNIKTNIKNNVVESIEFDKKNDKILNELVKVDGIIINNGGIIMKEKNIFEGAPVISADNEKEIKEEKEEKNNYKNLTTEKLKELSSEELKKLSQDIANKLEEKRKQLKDIKGRVVVSEQELENLSNDFERKLREDIMKTNEKIEKAKEEKEALDVAIGIRK